MATTKYLVNFKTNSEFNRVESKSDLICNIENSAGVNYILTNEPTIVPIVNNKKIQQIKQENLVKDDLIDSDSKIPTKSAIDLGIEGLDVRLLNDNFLLYSKNLEPTNNLSAMFTTTSNTYRLIDDVGYIYHGIKNERYWWYFKPSKNIQVGSYYHIEFSFDLIVSSAFVGKGGSDYPIYLLIGSGVRDYEIEMSESDYNSIDTDFIAKNNSSVDFATIVSKVNYNTETGIATIRLKQIAKNISFPENNSAITLYHDLVSYNGVLKSFTNIYENEEILDETSNNINDIDKYEIYSKTFDFSKMGGNSGAYFTLKGFLIYKFNDVNDIMRIFADIGSSGVLGYENFNLNIKYLRKGEDI